MSAGGSVWPPKGRMPGGRPEGVARPDVRQGHRTEYPADFPVTVKLSRKAAPIPVRQSVRAADLLAAARCSGQCLLADEDGECECRCEGEFHGALIDADVTIDPATLQGRAILRPANDDPDVASLIARQELRGLPFDAPASTLRLRVAMLAWDCGAREAAKRLGMTRSTYYHAMHPFERRTGQ